MKIGKLRFFLFMFSFLIFGMKGVPALPDSHFRVPQLTPPPSVKLDIPPPKNEEEAFKRIKDYKLLIRILPPGTSEREIRKELFGQYEKLVEPYLKEELSENSNRGSMFTDKESPIVKKEESQQTVHIQKNNNLETLNRQNNIKMTLNDKKQESRGVEEKKVKNLSSIEKVKSANERKGDKKNVLYLAFIFSSLIVFLIVYLRRSKK